MRLVEVANRPSHSEQDDVLDFITYLQQDCLRNAARSIRISGSLHFVDGTI